MDDEEKAGICMAYVTNKMLGGVSTECFGIHTTMTSVSIFHEMGHCALGITEHSDNEEDIMYWQIPVVAVITQEKLDRLCN